MKASEYLGQIRILNIRIAQNRDELERIQNEAYGVTGIRYDKDNVQTSPKDRMPDFVIRCMELDHEIRDDIQKNVELRHKIIDQIQGMPDWKHVKILHAKYVALKEMQEIADGMGLSPDYVRKLHTEALSLFHTKYRNTYQDIRPPRIRRKRYPQQKKRSNEHGS